MCLDDGAALGPEAFVSQELLNHVLEEEYLHLLQKRDGSAKEFDRATALELELDVNDKRRFQHRLADVQARLLLVQAASEGKLDGLRCPNCACFSVSVYYTHPAANEYHTWFVCKYGDFSMRAQNSSKPEFYSEERDRTGKQPICSVDSQSS